MTATNPNVCYIDIFLPAILDGTAEHLRDPISFWMEHRAADLLGWYFADLQRELAHPVHGYDKADIDAEDLDENVSYVLELGWGFPLPDPFGHDDADHEACRIICEFFGFDLTKRGCVHLKVFTDGSDGRDYGPRGPGCAEGCEARRVEAAQ